MHNDDDAGFPKLAAPVRRALSAAGYTRLDQLAPFPQTHLTGHSERENALLDAIAVRRGVYVLAPDVVAGKELE